MMTQSLAVRLEQATAGSIALDVEVIAFCGANWNEISLKPTFYVDDGLRIVPGGWSTHLVTQQGIMWSWTLRGPYRKTAHGRAASPALALSAAIVRTYA